MLSAIVNEELTTFLERAMYRSDRRFLSLVKASALIVSVAHPDGGMAEGNITWEAYTGQTSEQYRGYGYFNAVHKDDRNRVYMDWLRAVNQNDVFEAEMRLRRFDGVYRHFLCRGIPVLDDQGQVEEWVSTNTDITDKKEKEAWLTEAYNRERAIAQSLQKALLLRPDTHCFKNLEIAMFYEAASKEALVGGDFFDCITLNGKCAFVVGDVSGKGLIAATRTAEIKYALRAMIYNWHKPDVVMEKINNFFIDNLGVPGKWDQEETFIVLALAVIDYETGEGWFTKAGAEPPIHMDAKGKQISLGAGGLPLGVMRNETYEMQRFQLNYGDMLVMFTDGITEAKSPYGNRLFGYPNLKRTLKQHWPCTNIDDYADSILHSVKEFSGRNLSDDTCMFFIKRIKTQELP
jgi:PAS domain S-box-containing protein